MKITNNKNLPLPLVKAIEATVNQYDPGNSWITATGLIEPPRISALKIAHKNELEEDACDLLYSVQGTSIHTILEAAAKDLREQGYIAEERFYADVDGKRVSAKIDLFHVPTGVLQDYKITSVYSVKNGLKEDYAIQLNIGAELLRQNGQTVKALQIVAILRDWSKGEYERELERSKVEGFKCSYPPHQVAVLDAPLIPSNEVIAYMKERVGAHLSARSGPLPLCSPEERWEKPTKWAVVKAGAKRAYRLCDTEAGANLLRDDMGKGYTVEKRAGASTRCESYCPVARFCEQRKSHV